MFLFLNIFKKKQKQSTKTKEVKPILKKEKISIRKGELGEYKIDIQLAQMSKEYKYVTDIMIKNEKSKSGYSQIDHILITPYGVFVIETKNYQGTIYGGKNRKQWLVNGKIRFMSPFIQNYGHIQALKGISTQMDHVFSVVSFTKRCTFRLDELD
ncbi:nuclease-related domain-containing protein [Bacillus alkalisoli]|uniref:nuclease-related domain-containing protein n=1 Tax=Bacillus alkalisoli TaxID=2011008 RepID=UPI001D0CE8F1|nr:nuclease-related domain-containing protein [Bacillus alkalisoli]